MPHEDGVAYAPVVATVSLGSALCLALTPKPTDATPDAPGMSEEPKTRYNIPTRILQEPRSLLITTGTAYQDLLHAIDPTEVDQNLNAETVANWALLGDCKVFEENEGRNIRETRISLTYRDVLKVSSAASKVFGLGKR